MRSGTLKRVLHKLYARKLKSSLQTTLKNYARPDARIKLGNHISPASSIPPGKIFSLRNYCPWFRKERTLRTLLCGKMKRDSSKWLSSVTVISASSRIFSITFSDLESLWLLLQHRAFKNMHRESSYGIVRCFVPTALIIPNRGSIIYYYYL